MELAVKLTCQIFQVDPKTKKRKRIYRNELDPLMSWFIDGFYAKFTNATYNTKDTGGTSQNYNPADSFYNVEALGDATRGIVVGTSSAAPSFSHYALQSTIAHGTGSGQLYYYEGWRTNYIFTSPKKRQFVWQRLFRNLSGADITVNEIGYYYKGNYILTFMMCRDVISGGMTFQNGQYYLVQFVLEIGA